VSFRNKFYSGVSEPFLGLFGAVRRSRVMVEDHVVDQPPWKERRDVFFENRLQNILDIVGRVDFCAGFDETHGGLPTAADTSHEHYALRVRFLPKLGPTFFRPFAAKLVINLPDSVCVGQINPGLIDG